MSIKLELLSPARDIEIAKQAISHGADAVYIGGPSHGARFAAANSLDDIARLADYAHGYGVRVYATLNTIIYESELSAAEKLAKAYWHAGVDALIVQDMGLLRMDLPPIDLHASTQCNIDSVEKAVFLSKCGFSQLVLPREFSLEEIKAVRAAVPKDVALEAFVHGALCVSYSGNCHASFAACGRSANRGECAQMCRMAYDLVDANGNPVKDAKGQPIALGKHLLSLRDLSRIGDIDKLIEAGISSFKIEGRLKDVAYVKNATAAYRQAIDRIISASDGEYSRASWGETSVAFTPNVEKGFNRGFTPYFLNGRPATPIKMANFDSPKQIGEKVGVVRSPLVKSQKGAPHFTASLTVELHNGDGLTFFDKNGALQGFRLNKIEGNKLYPASDIDIKTGTTLYRNSDAKDAAAMSRTDTSQRLIGINLRLRKVSDGLIALSAEVPESGAMAETTLPCTLSAAKSPQTEVRVKNLSKLGGTRFRTVAISDEIAADAFIPASALSELRRNAIEALERTMRATYPYKYRREEDKQAPYPFEAPLTCHDNVANTKAEAFYLSHGATIACWALESQPQSAPIVSKRKSAADASDGTVMTTRYCLRRELGCCLRENGAQRLPEPLYITNKAATYRLLFDCSSCRMHLLPHQRRT